MSLLVSDVARTTRTHFSDADNMKYLRNAREIQSWNNTERRRQRNPRNGNILNFTKSQTSPLATDASRRTCIIKPALSIWNRNYPAWDTFLHNTVHIYTSSTYCNYQIAVLYYVIARFDSFFIVQFTYADLVRPRCKIVRRRWKTTPGQPWTAGSLKMCCWILYDKSLIWPSLKPFLEPIIAGLIGPNSPRLKQIGSTRCKSSTDERCNSKVRRTLWCRTGVAREDTSRIDNRSPILQLEGSHLLWQFRF